MMTRMLRRIFKRVRREIYEFIRPKQRTLKHIKYRGAEFIVFSNEDIGWRLIRDNDFESAEIGHLERYISKDSICADVGANIGIYSIFFARIATEGHVYAFEPHPLNRKVLALNAELNDLKNITIHDCLIGEKEGIVNFSISSDLAYSSMLPTHRKIETKSVQLKCTTLDNVFYHLNKRIDVLKIDVEGAELLALKGSSKLLSHDSLKPKALLVEINEENEKVYNYTPSDINKFMQTYGYTPYSIFKNKLVKGWKLPGSTEDIIFLNNDVI